MSDDIRNALGKILAQQLSLEPDAISDHATLESLGMDSLDRVEVVMKIEEAFDIEINDEDADKLNSLAELVRYVQELKQ